MNGKNAIESMSPILQTLFQDYPKLLNERTHPLLGSPTLNIGKILGGTQTNIVADHCTIDLDRRTIPGENEESVKQELKNLFQQQKLPIPEFVLSRSVPCPPLNTNPNLPFIQSLLRATQKRKTYGVSYFTDASPIAMGGTPAVVFGPGNIAQAHAKNEWIQLQELDSARAIILNFLQNLP